MEQPSIRQPVEQKRHRHKFALTLMSRAANDICTTGALGQETVSIDDRIANQAQHCIRSLTEEQLFLEDDFLAPIVKSLEIAVDMLRGRSAPGYPSEAPPVVVLGNYLDPELRQELEAAVLKFRKRVAAAQIDVSSKTKLVGDISTLVARLDEKPRRDMLNWLAFPLLVRRPFIISAEHTISPPEVSDSLFEDARPQNTARIALMLAYSVDYLAEVTAQDPSQVCLELGRNELDIFKQSSQRKRRDLIPIFIQAYKALINYTKDLDPTSQGRISGFAGNMKAAYQYYLDRISSTKSP